MTIDDYLRQVSFEGLEERLEVLLPKDTPDYEAKKQVYIDRLEFELGTIIQMGFPGYFLIVMDFIKWAKNNGVPVGPGRGSGAGSLVAYVLKITDLDPLAYDLLFERFLNPERISMPDFDVDFCMDGRDRVIDYVAEAYGRNAVSQIITFGTMAAKAVVRDVARVRASLWPGRPSVEDDPFRGGHDPREAYEMEEPLRALAVDEDAREIWEMALKLEGITRGTGKHAGGVVIAPTKLTDFAPIACDEEGGGLVTQFDKDDVEQAGLVKFDFLGLRTLTIIKWALGTINREQAKKGLEPVSIDFIPLDDKPTYQLLQRPRPRPCSTRIARHEGADQSSSPTVWKTSSRSWPCSAPARCSRAWWTTSSTASMAVRKSPIRTRTISTPGWSRCSSPPTASSCTRNR